MILLVGSSQDDVLYFETIIQNKVAAHPLFDRFPVTKGTIFNQNVMIVHNIYTSYTASAVVESIIKDENPLLVILLGKCKALSPDIKNGDIAISDSTVAIDVEQSEFKNVKVAQIPGFDQVYETNLDIIHILERCFDKFLIANAKTANFMCSNNIVSRKEKLESIMNEGVVLGFRNRIVLDSESFGTVVPCVLNGIPFVSIKAVDSEVGRRSDVNNFVKTLETYSLIGKAVVSFIGEIGRRDLVD